MLLDFKYHAFTGDAFSRMANGFYILYSRDRHLAAVGFVWTPLQSMADLVFLLGNHLWPALSHNDMAGSLVSALAMAGAVYQIRSALREWGLSRVPRLVLTACFALNPMILFYGGNGMSEGLYLFTLVASTRYLLRWMRRWRSTVAGLRRGGAGLLLLDPQRGRRGRPAGSRGRGSRQLLAGRRTATVTGQNGHCRISPSSASRPSSPRRAGPSPAT